LQQKAVQFDKKTKMQEEWLTRTESTIDSLDDNRDILAIQVNLNKKIFFS